LLTVLFHDDATVKKKTKALLQWEVPREALVVM